MRLIGSRWILRQHPRLVNISIVSFDYYYFQQSFRYSFSFDAGFNLVVFYCDNLSSTIFIVIEWIKTFYEYNLFLLLLLLLLLDFYAHFIAFERRCERKGNASECELKNRKLAKSNTWILAYFELHVLIDKLMLLPVKSSRQFQLFFFQLLVEHEASVVSVRLSFSIAF